MQRAHEGEVTPIITNHAIERYQQRVENVPESVVRERLNCPAIRTAIAFGARYVKLPGRQKVALDGPAIITILPGG